MRTIRFVPWPPGMVSYPISEPRTSYPLERRAMHEKERGNLVIFARRFSGRSRGIFSSENLLFSFAFVVTFTESIRKILWETLRDTRCTFE